MPLNHIDMTRVVEEGEKGLDTLSSLDRKVTRNLKRKYDEMNHIQKVGVMYV